MNGQFKRIILSSHVWLTVNLKIFCSQRGRSFQNVSMSTVCDTAFPCAASYSPAEASLT